jgi:hypothetical protein
MPSIDVDDDVFDALKAHAEPFVDTPKHRSSARHRFAGRLSLG